MFRSFYRPGLIKWLSRFNFPFGKKVTVIGGGFAGCEVADFLATKKKKVAIIGESNRVGDGIGPTTRWLVRRRLRDFGVRLLENAKVEAITQNGVKVTSASGTEEIAADTIVIARALKPNPELAAGLKGKVPVVYAIGDCAEPSRVREAIGQGFETAIKI